MERGETMRPVGAGGSARSASRRLLKSSWRRVRQPIARSRAFKRGLAALLAAYLRLVKRTSPLVPGSDRFLAKALEHPGIILAMWHGQHILCPVYKPAWYPDHRDVFAQRRCRAQRDGGATFRPEGGARLRRPSRRADRRQGWGGRAGRPEKGTRRRRDGGDDCRRVARQAARGGAGHRHAGAAFGPARRAVCGGHQPA